jgi:hypothetical protein|tara:strand:- start:482 stop:688 length:207 start_codon:yes stop_codon:yes gene_type:complete
VVRADWFFERWFGVGRLHWGDGCLFNYTLRSPADVTNFGQMNLQLSFRFPEYRSDPACADLGVSLTKT